MKKFFNNLAVVATLALIPALFAAYSVNTAEADIETVQKEAPAKSTSRVIDASVQILRSF
ncbi:MAG: hypothetical protein MUE72_12755 [Chitinophagaceae bacterium]|nr:hypothetical protein [Hydrotalea sp.]MCU0323282.1 hypothetical protein [Chitinophagaceae bacterium]